jgi:hypothetical protein
LAVLLDRPYKRLVDRKLDTSAAETLKSLDWKIRMDRVVPLILSRFIFDSSLIHPRFILGHPDILLCLDQIGTKNSRKLGQLFPSLIDVSDRIFFSCDFEESI